MEGQDMDVSEYVMQLLQRKYELPQLEDMGNFNYVESGYIDSMGIIQFIAELEDEFSIEFTDEELISPEFKTIGGIVRLIEEKRRTCNC